MRELQSAFEKEIDGEVRFDKYSRAMYSTDASVYQILPAGVVIPRSRDDVRKVVRLCREHGVSITARGGGTSQAGQAIGAGVQLDFSKYLNHLIELSPDARTVRIEPGIVLDELNAILQPYGLTLPLDLSTSNRATIGGMIANNSAGTRSVVYGKTLDYVEELTVLLADGSTVEMRSLDDRQWRARCEQTDREGECYRTVQQLAADHAEEIEKHYPKILRRVGGYNLDEFVEADQPRNLARLMVGSEGTLGLVLNATLRLVPLPKCRLVCVIHFHELLEALAATPVILEHEPSAVELVDRFILDTTQGKTEFAPLRDFIVGDPAAVLIVELMGDDADELTERLNRLGQDLEEKQLGYHVHRAADSDEQARIWKLRRAALGLSMSQTGDAKAISFVEDTAVSPDRLRDYIERFIAILDAHDTQAGFYAHASVGLLHIRPVVNMKTADGIERFAQIADEISDLVLEFGGALSGEHGDGLVRAPFQQKMFGPTLYGAFCELKQAFDPDGIFNPGKIVHAPELTTNLRFGTDYETRPIDTRFDFSDFGGISRAAEQCGGVGACRKTLTGSMCPSYMATRDEADSTRGRANALRLAISGQFGPDGLIDSELYPILELCLECKACKTECPTGVDMARLKSEFLHQFQAKHGISLRTRLLANIDRTAIWGSRFAPLSNWIAASPVTRWLMETAIGLDCRRMPPRFARRTFQHWWSRREAIRRTGTLARPGSAGGQECPSYNPNSAASAVAFFTDTFSNYYEPDNLIAAVEIAEHFGIPVTVPNRVCCGRPLISKGLLDQAAQQAAATTATLLPLVEQGLPIVFCEPSCYSAVRDDHPHLLRGAQRQQADQVAAACQTFEEWAAPLVSKQASNGTTLRTSTPQILLHAHCHQRALTGTQPAVQLLSAIEGSQVIDLDSGCCGMAGSFGYEHEHYDVSRTVGERKLFPAIRKFPVGATIVAPGFSCRHQIEHFSGIDAISTAVLLRSVLDCES